MATNGHVLIAARRSTQKALPENKKQITMIIPSEVITTLKTSHCGTFLTILKDCSEKEYLICNEEQKHSFTPANGKSAALVDLKILDTFGGIIPIKIERNLISKPD